MFEMDDTTVEFEMEANWEDKVEMDEELEDLGREAVAQAQRMAPVATGELRGSIAYRVSNGELILYADAPHAAYVELGTRKMAAQPYLRPALEATVNARR